MAKETAASLGSIRSICYDRDDEGNATLIIKTEGGGTAGSNLVEGVIAEGEDALAVKPVLIGVKTDEGLALGLMAGPNGSLPTYMADNSLFMGKVGLGRSWAQDGFVRPNNTTPYDAGDCISNTVSPALLSFAVGRIEGGTGTICSALLFDSANQATKADLELWLFQSAPTIRADGEAFVLTDAELTGLLGVISFTTPVVTNSSSGAAGNCFYNGSKAAANLAGEGVQFHCNSTSIYGLLVVKNAYVPVANEVFTIKLFVKRD